MSRLLFSGGPIVGMDPAVRGDAVLVEKGRISAVASLEELRAAAPDAVHVPLDGATLMPAFLDAHSHFTQTAFSFLQVSLDGAASEEEIAARLRAAAVPPGQWIQARDYDHNILPGGRHPTLAFLDRAAPENPLIIQHKSGHLGLLNSRSLALLGIGPGTPSPSGGRIGMENGRPNGYLEENAFFEAMKKVPMPGKGAILDAYRKSQALYASHGIATVQEGMLTKEMLPLYQLLLGQDLLKLDLVAYADPAFYQEASALLNGLPGGTHFRIGGMKIFLDGSPQGKTAWLRQPYEGGDFCGYGTLPDETVHRAFLHAAEAKTQLLAHCNGDAAAAQFLRCLAGTEAETPILATLRPVLIHGQILGEDQIPEAAALGAMVSFFVAHVYHWGDVHLRNLGPRRAARISPAASALRAGLPFTFHQDTPVIKPDMWETIWCAVCRKTRAGVLLGPEERISAAEALRAVTVSTAWQYGEERQKGSISPGKRADLIVVDKNPLEVPPEELRAIRVLRTYKDGEIVYG